MITTKSITRSHHPIIFNLITQQELRNHGHSTSFITMMSSFYIHMRDMYYCQGQGDDPSFECSLLTAVQAVSKVSEHTLLIMSIC